MIRRVRGLFRTLVYALAAFGGVGQSSMAAESMEFPFSDEQMIEKASSLEIEERRYLTYLYARLNKAKVARTVGAQVLAENPSDRQTLLVLASLAVAANEAEQVVDLAETFLSYYPGDHQGRYFLGAGYYQQGRYTEAEQVLADLKREQYRGRKFPYETDLASASAGAGQWYRSMLSYQELLRNHDLNDDLRSEVRRELDRIYREHGPVVDAGYRGVILAEGRIWRSSVSHEMHLTERHRLGVEGHQDRVSIERRGGLVERETRRVDYAADLRSLWGGRSESAMGIGHTPQGAFWDLRIRHEVAPAREVELSGTGNHRATDSLLLESLDGREDRLEARLGWLIEADLALNMKGHTRTVEVSGHRLGKGSGLEISLDQILRRRGAQWMVGYRGAWTEFETSLRDPQLLMGSVAPNLPPASLQGVLDNLVASRINRHGVGLVVSDDLTHVWSYRLQVGTDYDFVLNSLGYNWTLDWVFRPRKSIELGARGGYYSSATGSNAGGSAYLLDLSFRMYY